jgi:hypothetical protein
MPWLLDAAVCVVLDLFVSFANFPVEKTHICPHHILSSHHQSSWLYVIPLTTHNRSYCSISITNVFEGQETVETMEITM